MRSNEAMGKSEAAVLRSFRKGKVMLLAWSLCAVAILLPKFSNADACDALAAELVTNLGVVAAPRTAADIIPMRHSSVTEMSLGCPMSSRQNPDIFLNWDGAYPPAKFFDLAGRVGHIVANTSTKNAKDGAIKCQRAALLSSTEFAGLTISGVSFECQAFSRDGGGTTITIYLGSPDN